MSNWVNGLRELETQAQKCAEAPDDDHDAGSFHALIRKAFDRRVVTPSKVAERFGMSLPSVARWRDGVTAPHPIMRRRVCVWLARCARVALAQYLCSDSCVDFDAELAYLRGDGPDPFVTR